MRKVQCMRAGSIGLRVFLCIALLFSMCVIPARQALADELVTLSVGERINYGDWCTNWVTLDGAMAYCVCPRKDIPRSGIYRPSELNAPSGKNESVLADLWFSYNAPGFSSSMWPSVWYDQTPVDAGKYAVMSHLVLSADYQGDIESSLYGCNPTVKKWFREELFGIDQDGAVVKDDAPARQIARRHGEVPSNFSAVMICPTYNAQDMISFRYETIGSLELRKVSANQDVTADNSLYSLEGAVYGVFQDEDCQTLIGRLVTDEDGFARIDDLEPGTYYVKELDAPAGMAMDASVYAVSVVANQVANVNGGAVQDKPKTYQPNLICKKVDYESGEGHPQGDADLSGAEFTLSHFTNFDGDVSGQAIRSWTLRSNASGEVRLVDAEDLYLSAEGNPVLPAGTYLLSESVAPQGYLLSDARFVFVVGQDGFDDDASDVINSLRVTQGDEVDDSGIPVFREKMIRGGVRVVKSDAELKKPESLGGAFLSWLSLRQGITFAIFNKSDRRVKVGEKWFEPGQEVCTIKTHWDNDLKSYVAQTEADALPYGTYSVKEVSSNDSYLLSDGSEKTFKVRNDGMLVTASSEEGDLVFYNQVVRNDILIEKTAGDTGVPMSIPFKVTNKATGEAHVIVTNAEGKASTASTWNPHSRKTNANDVLLEREYIGLFDADLEAGVWYSQGEFGSSAPVNDALAALPYGEYDIEELRCAANEGYDLICDSFVVDSDSGKAAPISFEFVDNPLPAIGTWAFDGADGDKVVQASESMKISDYVSYKGLTPGSTYTVIGTLMDKQTGQPVKDRDGRDVAAASMFAPQNPQGRTQVDFQFDGLLTEGHDLVAFERLYLAEALIASHEDLEDEYQTVRVVGIRTTANDADDGDKLVTGAHATIVDKVDYSGLIPGCRYQLKAVLMDAVTGQPMLVQGESASATLSFVPDQAEGFADVLLTMDVAGYEGHRLVVFEELYEEGKLIARHADINDLGQSVVACGIGTELTDCLDGDHVTIWEADDTIKLVDDVAYKGLNPGETYTLQGVLMDGKTKGLLLDKEGNPVMSSVEFVPDEPNGVVKVFFAFSLPEPEGSLEIVAFEECLDAEGRVVAVHRDIEDKRQTVEVSKKGENPPEEVQPPDEEKPREAETLPVTGDPLRGAALALFAACVVACACRMCVKRGVWPRK